VNGRRNAIRSEDGFGEFEKSIAPAVETSVERVAEAVESIGRFHDVPIMHSLTALRTPYLPVELKRKLRRYPHSPPRTSGASSSMPDTPSDRAHLL
jgi:hypothetical protein